MSNSNNNASSSSSAPSCIVCRDYSAIDKFATDFSLNNISTLSEFEALQELRDAKTLMAQLIVVSKSLEDEVQRAQKVVDTLRKQVNDLGEKRELARAEVERLSKENPINAAALQAAKDKFTAAAKEFAERDLAFLEFYENQGQESLITSDHINNFLQLTTQKSQEIAIVLFNKCRQMGIIASDTDYVGRARLFFAWIALSIEFDPAADDPKKWADRSPADTLLSKVEVCKGFAKLFAMMFNAIPKTNNEPATFKAVAIEGWSKPSNHASPKKSPPDVKHAWNAFPYVDGDGKTQMKLIDTTWARKNTPGSADIMLDSQWFTMSNQAFLARHYPDDPSQQYVPDISKITLDAFWPRDLPTFDTRIVASALISQSSLVSTAYTVGNLPNLLFSFSPACPHVLSKVSPDVPTFALMVGAIPPQNDADWARVATFKLNPTATAWTASVDLSSFKPDGSTKVTVAVPLREGLWIQLVDGSEARDLQQAKDGLTWEYVAQWQAGAPPQESPGLFTLVGNVFKFDKKGKKPVPN